MPLNSTAQPKLNARRPRFFLHSGGRLIQVACRDTLTKHALLLLALLRSMCLNCRRQDRASTDDRSAGLPNHPMFVADDPNCADLSCPARMFPPQNAPRSRRPAAATKRGSHAEPIRLLASDRSPQCTQTTTFLTDLISVFTGESTDRGGIMACLPHASSLHTPAGSHLRVVSFAIPSFAADLPSMVCEDGACQ